MDYSFDIQQLVESCRFEAVRSSGKGGQNVNKVSTKMILLFDVNDSELLTGEQKMVVLDKLHTRISKDGILRISSGRERSQDANRKLVIEKFKVLILDALTPEIERIATLPTKASKRKRLDEKKRRSQTKSTRQIFDDTDFDI